MISGLDLTKFYAFWNQTHPSLSSIRLKWTKCMDFLAGCGCDFGLVPTRESSVISMIIHGNGWPKPMFILAQQKIMFECLKRPDSLTCEQRWFSLAWLQSGKGPRLSLESVVALIVDIEESNQRVASERADCNPIYSVMLTHGSMQRSQLAYFCPSKMPPNEFLTLIHRPYSGPFSPLIKATYPMKDSTSGVSEGPWMYIIACKVKPG